MRWTRKARLRGKKHSRQKTLIEPNHRHMLNIPVPGPLSVPPQPPQTHGMSML